MGEREVVAFVSYQQDQIMNLKKENKKLAEENKRLRYRIEFLHDYNNQLLKKPRLTDVLPNAAEIIMSNNELAEENERLHHLKVLAHAFIVEKGLEGEFIKWSNEIDFLKNMVIDDE